MALPKFPVEGVSQERHAPSSKAAWVKTDPKHANFPKQAVDRTPLFDAWTRHNHITS
jgi:hypothetical protein